MNPTLSSLTNILGAAPPSNPLGGGWVIPLVMIVIFYVLLIRPQQKQRKELAARQAALKKGDKVITIGGMHALVNAVSDKTVSLKISEGIYVKYDKVAIATVVPSKSDSTEKVEDAK